MILGTLYIGLTEACARMSAPITEGLTGGELELKFESAAWEGLTKRVFFKAGSESRSALVTGSTVVIPWEVTRKSGKAVQTGVIGTDGENVIIPTVWSFLGNVRPAAEETDKETLDPTLPIWAQIQKQMADLESRANAGEFDGEPGPQGKAGADGGYYTPTVTQPDESTVQFDFVPSSEGMPVVTPVQVALPSAESVVVDEDGYLTTTAGGFEIDDDGYILL